MLEKTTVIQYINDSSSEEFKSLIKNLKLLKRMIFFMVFDNKKTCSVEYIDAHAFIPKDEYSFYQKGNSPILLVKVYVIDVSNFNDLRLTIKSVNSQINGLNDLNNVEIKSFDKNLKAEEKENEEKEELKKKISTIMEQPEESEPEESSDSNNSLIDPEIDYMESNEDDDKNEKKYTEFYIKDEIKDNKTQELKTIIKKEKNDQTKLVSVNLNYVKKLENEDSLLKFKEIIEGILSSGYKSYNKPSGKKDAQQYNRKMFVKEDYCPRYLTSFCFTDNYIKKEDFKEGWEAISKFLKSKFTPKAKYLSKEDQDDRCFHMLRNLDLSMNSVSDDTVNLIMPSLYKVRLHKLNLGNNLITKEGCYAIGKWLEKNKSLKELFLQCNDKSEFGVEGIDRLSTGLIKHRKLQFINLSNMNLSESGGLLYKVINEMRGVRKLTLRDCSFTTQDLNKIINSILTLPEDSSFPSNTDTTPSSKYKIEELDLSENNSSNQNNSEKIKENIKTISKLFLYNNSIFQLTLEKFSLTNDNIQELMESIAFGLKITPEDQVKNNDENNNENNNDKNEEKDELNSIDNDNTNRRKFKMSNEGIELKLSGISLCDNGFDYKNFVEYFKEAFKEEKSLMLNEVEISISSENKKASKQDKEVLEAFENMHTPLSISISG